MISSYLASYNYTALQYDNQINEHQRQIDEYEEQMKKAEAEASIEDKTVTEEETVSDNGISTETISVVASTENTTANIEELKKQRDALITAQDSAKKEKTRALRNLELQQITTIEQQIAGYNDTILSLETNLVSAKFQMEAINRVDNET